MINYTDRLKGYWKSKNLTFIAKFKRFNKNVGFFNDFTNPISKMKLYYPEFDGVEVLDRRVSFYCGNSANLIDGDFYNVELEYTDSPKGKNNPYSLQIKTVSELNQDKVKKLLTKEKKNNKYEGLIFYGCYKRKTDSYALFKNVMYAESGEVLMSERQIQNVYVTPRLNLIEDKYYAFKIVENKGRLPNAKPNTIKELDVNPYQEFIRLRFERLNNPEANKMIANLMREIGKGMYSSKQRMIFELLQNADDAPGKEKVEFHIDINGDYFFVMHDGTPFSQDDVEAITSAAESTKRDDNKKTGYKGIGFKSVFTDSTEVWLKSGGYQFAFLRSSPLFEDFDSFYFSSERYQKYPELLEEDKLKYRNQRLRFDGSTDIPWQVIPIWKNSLPREFIDSNFSNFNNPVQFALKLGENNIEGYKAAIDNITKSPQFLLFLRNTSKFRSPKNGVTVLRNDNNNVIEIIKSKRAKPNQVFHYTKQTYENVAVSDEAFAQLGIGLKKQSKINDYNEVTYFFTDIEGREIETIPPKLASATKTEISFGISLVNNKISPEKEYAKGLLKYSSLFTYLPMEDTRFQLPFLVNADFIPSSDRQRIQGDNLWNKYIMIKVAEKHVVTLAHFAHEFLKDKVTNNSYLSLLLKTPLPEDDTAQQIIDSYNTTYLEQLKNIEIVVNDNNQLQLLSDTIVDDSGLIELFGHEIFYDIINTEKRLPHSNLETDYLKDYKYLNVEVIDLETLANQISHDHCEKLGWIIKEKALYNEVSLLDWLNKLVKYIPEYFGKIPFIVHNNALFSIERLIEEEDAWIINDHTSPYADIIKELGYHTVQLNLVKHTNIKNYFHLLDGYINDKTLAYERIASNKSIASLPVSIKIKLIDFLQSSDFMSGIGKTKYFGELKLFIDETGTPRPLRKLLSRQIIFELNSIGKFKIHEEEYNSIAEDLRKELINDNNVFTSFILDISLFNEWSQQFDKKNIDVYVSDLKTIYSWLNRPDEISSADWASIPWLYIDDETRFVTADKVYWSNAFNKFSIDKFETIRSVLHSNKIKTIPIQECGSLIKVFPIKTDNNTKMEWLNIEELEMLTANTLLDWMEDDGGFNEFFRNYIITPTPDNNRCYTIEAIEGVQVFDGSDEALKKYIKSNVELSSAFVELDENLSGKMRSRIGLLQERDLINALIETREYDQGLARYWPNNISLELLNSFIVNLPELSLKTDKEYGSNSPEHIIINNLLRTIDETIELPANISNLIEILKNKTLINNQPLTDFDTSNTISFGKGKTVKGLQLSDVLNEYEGESDILEEILVAFTSIKEKRKLRKYIFRTRKLTPQEIHYKIEKENGLIYNEAQVAFHLIDKSYGNINRSWSKKRFDSYYLEQDNIKQLEKAYQNFLDILFDLDFSNLSELETILSSFKFKNLTLSNYVDKSFAIESEELPKWLNEWVSVDQDNKIKFLAKLGYNGPNSAIVNLRRYMSAKDYDSNTVIKYFEDSKPNMQIIWNSIIWLSQFNSSIVTQNISIIEQINNYIDLKPESIKQIPVPLIKSINSEGDRTYYLQVVRTEVELLKLNIEAEFAESIFNALNNSFNESYFIDKSAGKLLQYLSFTEIVLEESVDLESLESNSKLWKKLFYERWEHSSEYPIYIYEGSEIPYLRSFKHITINTFTRDLKVDVNGKYYVSMLLKEDPLDCLPSSFPNDKLNDLKEWERRTLKNPELLEVNPFEEKYNETFDRMIQDRYGISNEKQKKENRDAKKIALYFLDEKGYNVNDGHSNHDFAAIYNIKDSGGNSVNFIVKSAVGGLLFLNKNHWEMLRSDDTKLIVIYPGKTPRIFNDRMELLSDELQDKVLFRLPNNKSEHDIDGVFSDIDSNSHLILVTSDKMKESLFSKIKLEREFVQEDDVAIGGENFTL